MTFYSLELMSLPEENSILIEMLHSGGFSVNRTGNNFSGVEIDIALQQTINVEAINRLKCIMAYADVASAVNRWVVTNSVGKFLIGVG